MPGDVLPDVVLDPDEPLAGILESAAELEHFDYCLQYLMMYRC